MVALCPKPRVWFPAKTFLSLLPLKLGLKAVSGPLTTVGGETIMALAAPLKVLLTPPNISSVNWTLFKATLPKLLTTTV